MSGRVISGYRDGKAIRGYRKTARVVTERRPLHEMPDWLLSFLMPPHLLVRDGVYGQVSVQGGRGAIAGKSQKWVIEQLAKFFIAVGRDVHEIRVDALLSREEETRWRPIKREDPAYLEVVVASGRPVVMVASRYMRAAVFAG
jgi:hypothetical protein